MTETVPLSRKSVPNIMLLIGLLIGAATLGMIYFKDMLDWMNWWPSVSLTILGLTALACVFWKFSKFNFITLSLIYFTTLAAFLGSLSEVVSVIIFWLTCLALGRVCLSRNRQTNLRRSVSVILSLTIGYVVITLLLAILVYIGQLNTISVGLISLGAFTLYWVRVRYLPIEANLFLRDQKARTLFDFIAFVGAMGVISLLFVMGMQPDIGPDAIAAYRPMILQIVETGRLDYNPENSSVRLQPFFAVWTQTYAVLLSDSIHGAKVMNLSYLFMAIYILLQMSAETHRRSALLSIVILFSLPLLTYTTLSAFYDNAIVFQSGLFVIVAFMLGQKSEPFGDYRGTAIIAMGLISAMMVLTKLTTIFAVPAFIIFFLMMTWTGSKNIGNMVKDTLIIGVIAIVPVALFMGFVYWQSGSPVFPYYNSVFKSPYYVEQDFGTYHTGYLSVRLLWDMTFQTAKYAQSGSLDGQLGVLASSGLISLISLIFVRSRAAVAGVVCFFVAVILTSAFQNSPRYLLISLPFLFIALQELFERSQALLAVLLAFLLGGSNFLLLPRFGYGPIITSAMFKQNHPSVDLTWKPIKVVSDHLSATYGPSGRVLFMRKNGGFSGDSLETSWYNDLTNQAFLRLNPSSEEALRDFLSDREVEIVVVTRDMFGFLTRNKRLAVLDHFQMLSSHDYHLNDVRVFEIKPEVWAKDTMEIAGRSYTKREVFSRFSDFEATHFDFTYSCSGNAAVQMFEQSAKPTVQSKQVTLICDETVREAYITLRTMDVDPITRGGLASLLGPQSSLTIDGGTLYSR